MAVVLKSPQEVAIMREAGRIVAAILQSLAEKVQPGLATSELDKLVERRVRAYGAVASFKGYRGYPASLCVSINNEVVHGIPGARRLEEGDIVSLDVGVIHRGYQGDAAVTVGVGRIDARAQELIRVTEEALLAGIAALKENGHLGDYSAAVQSYVESRSLGVVRQYVGHGIGREMHEEPQIPNFGSPAAGPLVRRGMTLALEPMVTAGDWHTRVEPDGWTVVTVDGSLSAHCEHTVAITENGAEILTRL